MQFSASTSPKPINPHPARATQRLVPYRWFILIAISVFVLDQVTKYWISHAIPFGASGGGDGAVEVIRSFFYIIHVGNPGAAWSLFSGQNTLLGFLAVFTLIAIFYWRRSLALKQLPVQISFGLLCGGIAGNLLDRVMHGYVVDFLDLHFWSYRYPTFNVADCGICVGVIIYLFYSLRNPSL